jgi:DNA-binding NarL/FixJ family response regulator
MIRVLLVDDHTLLRAGVTQFLATVADLELVGEATDGLQAIEIVGRLRPDVVLMDISLPRLDGIEAARRIVGEWPDTRIIGLTSFYDRKRVSDMLAAGACGYLLKDVEPDELVRGIRAAVAGDMPLAPAAARVLLDISAAPPAPALTERERQVLELVARGMSNRQIAEALHMAEATVKVHLSRIFHELDVDNRTAAAIYAHRLGLAGEG